MATPPIADCALPRRRIALFCPSLVSTGGVERAIATLSDVLAEHCDVWAVSLDAPGTDRSFNSRSRFVPIGPSLNLPLPLRPISYAVDAYRLLRVKRQLGIEITVSSLWRADLISILSAGRDRKVSVCQINIAGNDTNRLLMLFRPLVAWVYQRFDRVVACTTTLREEMRALFGLDAAKCTVIHNVVPPALTRGAPEQHSRVRMLFCGRFVREKNVLALIDIFAQARAVNPAIQLIMIGDGPLRADVEALILSRGLSRSVDFDDAASDVILTGFVSDFGAYVARCDFQIVPSIAEGIPLALIDGFSVGVPALVSDFGGGGAREALGVAEGCDAGAATAKEANCGFLLPVPNARSGETLAIWRDHVVLLASDERLRRRLGQGARVQARSFHPEVVAPQWRHVLEELR